MAVDNLTGSDASITGEIKRIKERLDQLSSTPLGKVKFATGFAPNINPVITPTPTSLSTTVEVPAFATSCGYSVFASGVGQNTTASVGFLTVRVEVIYGSYSAFTFQSASNLAAGETGNVTVPMVDTFDFPAGGGLLTLRASINNGAGTWTNTSLNAVWPEGLFVFQY